MTPVLRLLDMVEPTVRGKALYKRLLVKRIGWMSDKEIILDNCDEEDFNWFKGRNIQNVK